MKFLQLSIREEDLLIAAIAELISTKRCKPGWTKEEYCELEKVRDRLLNNDKDYDT